MTLDTCVTLGDERETVLSVADLLRQMDEAAVEQAIVQPADRSLAVDNRSGNEAMLRAAHSHPDRLIAACTVNPWFGAHAVEELRRAIGDGARMVVFAPALQGFILGDDLLDKLLDVVSPLRLPVYMHTGPHLQATPWQLVDVAERYPDVPFLMGHSGATDFWTDVPAAALSCENIYLESSFARPFAMINHLRQIGQRRGVMGSGAPRNDLRFEWDQMRAVFDPTEHTALFGGTMRALLEGVAP